MAPDAQHDWRLDGGISQASDAKLVNINTAAVEELNRLGGRFARASVAGRPYASIDELVSKRVLTRSTFSQIKDRITAN
jgi:DNA uptake protein ComE-like DNA-binding protein